MNRKSGIVAGILLILLGLIFLANELFPEFFEFWDWPFVIIGLGLVFLLWAIFSGSGGLAIPGSILTGIGGILYYQNLNNAWASWAFLWALIPAFVGLGILLSGLINRRFKHGITGGLTLILISAILFFAFGSAFGLQPEITKYWPVLLVILGAIALFRALLSNRNK